MFAAAFCLELLYSHNARAAQPQAPAKSEMANRNVVKNWILLCAPCHDLQATGTDYGPPLLGGEIKRRFNSKQFKFPRKPSSYCDDR